MKFTFKEIVDIDALQDLLDELYRTTSVPTAILTVDGEVLTASGWKRICTHFHRIHPQTACDCTTSDTSIHSALEAGEKFAMYRCPRGLVDASSPIVIEGEHVANIFIGQFFTEMPTGKTEQFFREQARKFGFDEEDYIDAYREIPVFSEDQYRAALAFLVKVAELVANIGLSRLHELEAMEIVSDSERKFRRLVESTKTAPWEVDCSTHCITFMGHQIEPILGFPSDHWKDTETFLASVHPDDHALLTEDCISGRDSITDSEVEFRMMSKDGREVWMLNISSIITGDDGKKKIIGFLTDITEKKKIQHEHELLQEQLLQSQKLESIGRLAGGIAHDFNNLLTVISGNTEMILLSLSPDNPIYGEVCEIQESSRRAAKLTSQLLAFSRRQIIEPRILNLNDVLLSMDKMLRRLISENIELIVIPGDNLWNINIDKGQIEQVLTNLVVNARDAMPDGGMLSIETNNCSIDEGYAGSHTEVTPGDYVMVSVSDSGYGMNQETLARIFEPFFTTKALGKGTGLGLSTCFGIVKQNNGFMSVYSEVSHGTIFKVYLPAIIRKTEPERKESVSHESVDINGTETILVVEDEPSVRSMVVRMLMKHGYTVYDAGNGEEALRFIQNNPDIRFDLIITDAIMPRMGGKEFSEKVKILLPSQKVLFMSGYSENAISHQGILEEGLAFITKPFMTGDFLKKVRSILDE